MWVKTFLFFMYSIFMVSASAGEERFDLQFRSMEEVGLDWDEVYGQKLYESSTPVRQLVGIPAFEGGRVHYLAAYLGDGENPAYQMVVIDSKERHRFRWIMDRNQNHDLSDDEILEQTMKDDRVKFPPLALSISVGGKLVPYMAGLSGYYRNDSSVFYLGSRCCRVGEIRLNGQMIRAALVDNNSNGLYNDIAIEGDLLYISPHEEEERFHSIFSVCSYWISYDDQWFNFDSASSRMIIHSGKWNLFEPSRDGTFICSKGMAVKLAPLRTQFDHIDLLVHSPSIGCIWLKSRDGVLELAPGAYTLKEYRVNCCEEGKPLCTLCPTRYLDRPLMITEGGNRIELCLPLHQRITAETSGNEVVFEEEIIGRWGEGLDLFCDGFWRPEFTIEDLEGKEWGKGRFDAG